VHYGEPGNIPTTHAGVQGLLFAPNLVDHRRSLLRQRSGGEDKHWTSPRKDGT